MLILTKTLSTSTLKRKDITGNMAQVITLEAELEQVQKTTEEAYDLSKYLFLSVLF